MNNSKRVVVNTIVQYLRSVISIIITLYTSRVVLENLGASDFGLYSLVAGVISMFAFLQSNLSSTIVRFLSFYRGRNDKEKIVEVFNNSVSVQLFLAAIIVSVLFFITEPVFESFLNIPLESIQKAKMVYWIMLISLFFNLLSLPYYANIVSHENIVYSSIVQIIDALLKLPIALSLIYVSSNKLEWYSSWICAVIILNFMLYFIYCRHNYEECQKFSIRKINIDLFREMLSFMGWNSYGTFCIVARTQGISILLNKFYTTAINAAYGIAFQVSGQLGFLSSSLVNAINPQIIKAEGAGDRSKMFRISEISCKFSFLLMSIVSIPSIFHMQDLLDIWLKEVPEYTTMFCRYVLLATQVDLLTSNLAVSNQAIGNVKMYNITQQTLKILTLPCAYIALRYGYGAEAVMLVFLIFECICVVSRVLFLHYNINLSIGSYIKNVFLDVIIPVLITSIACFFLSEYLDRWMFILNYFVSFFLISILTYFIGLRNDERNIVNRIIAKIFIRKK